MFVFNDAATTEIDTLSLHAALPFLPSCDDFYLAVAAGFPLDLLPEDTGIVVADRFGGEVLRPSNRRPRATVARNRQILFFAHAAGGQLYRLQNSAL